VVSHPIEIEKGAVKLLLESEWEIDRLVEKMTPK